MSPVIDHRISVFTKTNGFLERSDIAIPPLPVANRIGEPGRDAEGVGNMDDVTEDPSGVLPRDCAVPNVMCVCGSRRTSIYVCMYVCMYV